MVLIQHHLSRRGISCVCAIQVYMKSINHILIWMLDKTYKDFMPTKDKVLTLGCDLETALIPDLLQSNMLRFVPCCISLMDGSW